MAVSLPGFIVVLKLLHCGTLGKLWEKNSGKNSGNSEKTLGNNYQNCNFYEMDILHQPLLRAAEMINSVTHRKCLAEGKTKVSTPLTLKEQEIRTDKFHFSRLLMKK